MSTHATVRPVRLPVGQMALYERPSDEDRHSARTTGILGRAESDGHGLSSDDVQAPRPFSTERQRDLILAGFRDPPGRHRLDAGADVSQQPPAEMAADPFVAALARYVEALHRRYPDGPEELRHAGLDSRAKVSQMITLPKDPAA